MSSAGHGLRAEHSGREMPSIKSVTSLRASDIDESYEVESDEEPTQIFYQLVEASGRMRHTDLPFSTVPRAAEARSIGDGTDCTMIMQTGRDKEKNRISRGD
jgi:hypothetical protein